MLRDNDEIRFVPVQHAYLDVNSASSLEKTYQGESKLVEKHS
jgi:hypothetical protein